MQPLRDTVDRRVWNTWWSTVEVYAMMNCFSWRRLNLMSFLDLPSCNCRQDVDLDLELAAMGWQSSAFGWTAFMWRRMARLSLDQQVPRTCCERKARFPLENFLKV
eukprot:g29304.t1